MNQDFKTWLVEEYGLQESSAISRVANISTIEKYYGEDIDTIIKNRGVHGLLNELSYSTDDERNNRPQKHKVPIHGNVRTGSATLKQAVNRYVEFYEATGSACENHNGLNDLVTQVKKVLEDFKPSKIQSSYSSSKNEVKNYIQLPLLEILRDAIPSVEWNMEVKLSHEVNDSIDILGKVDDETLVIIEIDTHRTDQICKKFVSRQALTDDKNTIYIVVTYPNDNCMGKYEKNALKKYEKYIHSLVQLLAQGSNLDKRFYLRQLL